MEGYGAKVGATAIIWGFATGMLAICIPLTAIAKSGSVLPLVTLLGAGGSTVAIWRSSRKKSAETAKLQNEVKALNERLETLEAIYTSDRFKLSQTSQPLEFYPSSKDQTTAANDRPDVPSGEREN